MMSLIELQDVLGENIRNISEAHGGTREYAYVMEKAEYTAKIAKQMINNADVILRTDKLCGKTDRSDKVVG